MAARKILRLTPEYAKAATECVAETFGRAHSEDPFTWILNFKKHHWHSMSRMFIDRAAAQKNPLSVVALNTETGKVDGVMVNEDWKLIQPSDYRRLPSDWRPVRAVFSELHTRFKATVGKTVEPGELLHCLYFTCVRPEARQQGVMRALWGETLQVAEDNNFEGVVAEASSKDVRDVLDGQLGFDEVASVEYEKFMFQGTPIFKELVEKDPAQLTKLTIHLRKINSNLY